MTNREKIDPFDALLMNQAVRIGIVEAVDLACIVAHAFRENGATPQAMRLVFAEIDNQAINFYLRDKRLEWKEARTYNAECKRRRHRQEAADKAVAGETLHPLAKLKAEEGKREAAEFFTAMHQTTKEGEENEKS